MLAIFLVNVFETHGPFDVGGSGIAAKDEGDRLLPTELGEVDDIFPFDITEFKIGRDVTCSGCGFVVVFLPGGGFSPVFYGLGHIQLLCGGVYKGGLYLILEYGY